MKHKITGLILISLSISLLQACGNNEGKIADPIKKDPGQKTGTEVKTTGRFKNENVSFKINGTGAFRAFDREDKPIAQLNAVNDNLTISMHGDIKEGVLQGMLSIRKMPFSRATGEIASVKATYIRYFDERSGKSISYNSSNFVLTLTKCEKLPDGAIGEEWMLSGTFSGNLKVNPYEEVIATERGTDKELNFTEGKFENIKMVVLGRKK